MGMSSVVISSRIRKWHERLCKLFESETNSWLGYSLESLDSYGILATVIAHSLLGHQPRLGLSLQLVKNAPPSDFLSKAKSLPGWEASFQPAEGMRILPPLKPVIVGRKELTRRENFPPEFFGVFPSQILRVPGCSYLKLREQANQSIH